jgi:hypothetical protein
MGVFASLMAVSAVFYIDGESLASLGVLFILLIIASYALPLVLH